MAAIECDSETEAAEYAYQYLRQSIAGARTRYRRLYQRGTSFSTIE